MSISRANLHLLLLFLLCGCLFFAYFVEYVMNLIACPLCVYQRFPYLILIALSIISLSSEKNYSNYYLITILGAIILAAYHTGVERGMFASSALCSPLVSIGDKLSATDFKKMLYSNHVGTCTRPALVILGLSMTEWNLFLNIFLFMVFVKYRKL